MPSLTVVASNRNRLDINNDDSLFFFKSLGLQDYADFEIIIVDGGSDNYSEIKKYFESNSKIPVRFLQHRLDGKFKKALLNNIGIRAAKSPYVMCTDVDILFFNKFISILMQNVGKNILVESRTTFLTALATKKIHNGQWKFFDNYTNYTYGRFKRRTTPGGCQCLHIDDWHRLGGYNEQFEGWGVEDIDIVKRADIAKMQTVWLGDTPEKVMLFHQPHARNKIELFGNRSVNIRKYWSSKTFRVNPDGWGNIKDEILYNKNQEISIKEPNIEEPHMETTITTTTKTEQNNKARNYVNQEMVNRVDVIANKILKDNYRNKYRDRFFPLLINEMNLKIGVEIGVDKAGFSKQILEETKIEKYVCIDTWQDNFGSDYKPEYYNKDGNVRFNEARETLRPFLGNFEKPWEDSGRAIMLRMTSLIAATKIIDNSLDFCYIDGDHSLEGIYDDIKAWIPKVKLGGIISGHDFKDGPKSGINDHWGDQLDYRIKTVMDDYTRRHGYKLNVIGGVIKNWWFIKNKEP